MFRRRWSLRNLPRRGRRERRDGENYFCILRLLLLLLLLLWRGCMIITQSTDKAPR
jgi:hypothetical protein